MTDVPKRIWANKSINSECVVSFASPSEQYCIEYIRADLSADLVRAALERAAERLLGTINREYGDHRDYRKAIRAMVKDDEAVEAIITSVLGEPT